MGFAKRRLRQVGVFCFASMGVAHGAEGFEDFGDGGGIGAFEPLGDRFGRNRLFVFKQRGADGFDAFGEGFGPREFGFLFC